MQPLENLITATWLATLNANTVFHSRFLVAVKNTVISAVVACSNLYIDVVVAATTVAVAITATVVTATIFVIASTVL